MNRQARRSWIVLLATVAVTFVATRLRVIWLADVGDGLSVLAPLIDRYAFVAAIAVRSIGWWAFRRSVLPLAISLVVLIASIAAGIVRAGLFVDGATSPLLNLTHTTLHGSQGCPGKCWRVAPVGAFTCAIGEAQWRGLLMQLWPR